VASQGVRRRPAAIAILQPHDNHEWRIGLAVNGLYLRDKVSIQKAPLRSAKCADNKMENSSPFVGDPPPTVDRHPTTVFAGMLWVVTLSLRSVN